MPRKPRKPAVPAVATPPDLGGRKTSVRKTTGEAVHRTTLYFPVALAVRLRVHCAKTGQDMTKVVTTAVMRLLDETSET